MSETFYKPLTPSFRAEINSSIDKNIAELRTCSSNVFVNMQIYANEQVKKTDKWTSRWLSNADGKKILNREERENEWFN